MKYESFVSALSLLASCLASNLALASTATASFSVSVIVQASCQVSYTAMTLGAYSAVASNERPAVSVNCTNPTQYNVALSPGRAAGPDATTRQMTGPATGFSRYALLSNTTPSLDWGRLVKMYAVPGTDSGPVEALTVSGETMGKEYVAPGAYADTIIVAIIF